MAAAQQTNVLEKYISASVCFKPFIQNGCIFSREYQLTYRTKLVIFVYQRNFQGHFMGNVLQPYTCTTDYIICFREFFNNIPTQLCCCMEIRGVSEFTESCRRHTTYATFSHGLRDQDSQYTSYAIKLRFAIREPRYPNKTTHIMLG